MRWLVFAITVAAVGCGDDLEKMCFKQRKIGACNELCDVKDNQAACGKATELRMDMCLKQGDKAQCEYLCDKTGVEEFCHVAARPSGPGPLTKDELLAVKVSSGEEFETAKQRVERALGRSVYHDTRLQWWGVLEGDACFGLGFQWKDDWVGEVVGPGPMEGDLYAHCKAAAQLNECAKEKSSAECRAEIETPEL